MHFSKIDLTDNFYLAGTHMVKHHSFKKKRCQNIVQNISVTVTQSIFTPQKVLPELIHIYSENEKRAKRKNHIIMFQNQII